MEEGEIAPKSMEEGDLPSCTSCTSPLLMRIRGKYILAAEPARGLLIFELRAFQGVQTLTNRSKANVNKLTGSCMGRCFAKPHQRSNPVRNRHQRSPFA